MARQTGTVKWFSRDKGYGFIHTSTGEDVFAHHSEITGDGFRTLRQGEAVEFEITESEKGPKARQIVRLDGADEVVQVETGRVSSPSGGGDKPERNSLAAHIMAKLGGRFFRDEG
jgi:CspA family cold shock protein